MKQPPIRPSAPTPTPMYGTAIQVSEVPGSSPGLQRDQRAKPFRIQHHGVVEYMPKQAPAFPKLLPRPVMPGNHTTQDAIFMSSNCIYWEAGSPAYRKNGVSDQSEQLIGATRGKPVHGIQSSLEPSKTDLTSCIPVVRQDRESTHSNTPEVSESPEDHIPVCDLRPTGILELESNSSS